MERYLQYAAEVRKYITFEDKKTSTEGFVQYVPEQKEIVVVFRETEGAFPFHRDWMSNLNILKKRVKTDKRVLWVHLGFYQCYASTVEAVTAQIHSLIERHPEVENVTFYGHSLGGGLAAVFYVLMRDEFISKHAVKLITSGQPRVFGWLSALKLRRDLKGASIVRLRNDADWATGLPPFAFVYAHFCPVSQIGNRWRFWTNFRGWHHNAHTPKNYLKNLGK